MSGRIRVECAWCHTHIKGDLDAEVISHGLCTDCFSAVVNGDLDLEINSVSRRTIDDWTAWQDIGGEG